MDDNDALETKLDHAGDNMFSWHHHWRAGAALALDEHDQLPMMYSLGNISRQSDYHHNDNDPRNDGNDS